MAHAALYWVTVGVAQYVVVRHLGRRAPAWIPATLVTGLTANLALALWIGSFGRRPLLIAGALLALTAAAVMRAYTIELLAPPPAGVTPEESAAQHAA
jgi:hypothetical protein